MALTESNMLRLGTKAPDFKLYDTLSEEQKSFQDIKGSKATVVMFICNHCPYVIHVNRQIVDLANDYLLKGVGFAAISSNDIENYPQDAPEIMAVVGKALKYPFPYLYDESQDTAKAYDAACTPDFYVFDKDDHLVYRGRLDENRPSGGKDPDGKDLRAAIDAVLEGIPVPTLQFPSAGCNIKWKK
ncbi:MAG TPA: thioredoxin family protein [Saprospirales bacterium]|nr:thioredoxin family protein [Saprospirales bacterium]HRQ29435.1 thioredoxin family protein [Saprospiraceae bacterium]